MKNILKISAILIIVLVVPFTLLATTWGTWNGITVGSSSSNISKWNGGTIGTSSTNIGGWNGLTSPGGSSGGNVTATVICANGGNHNATTQCTATGTPTVGGKAVIFASSYATTAMTASNVTCTDSTTANTYTYRGSYTAGYDYIGVWDATLSTTHSGMYFQCTTTQTGWAYGLNIHVFVVTNFTSGIDAGPTCAESTSSATSWDSPSVTPSATGDAILSAGVWTEAASAMTVTSGWDAGSLVDATAYMGVGMSASKSNYTSTSAIHVTYTCSGTCTASAPHICTIAYK